MSNIRRYYDTMMGRATEPHAAIQETAEAGIVGIAAGMVAAKRVGGLDGPGGVPLDGAAGALGMAAATFAPVGAGTRQMIRRAASHAIAIASFRKTEEWAGKSSTKTAGEFGSDEEDPIVKAARAL
jgi:hypothetical protein